MRPDFNELDLHVARARIILSIVGLLSIYIDPSPKSGGFLHFNRWEGAILLCYVGYSAAIYLLFHIQANRPHSWQVTVALDLMFATVIACFTEGGTSPSLMYFVFAIVAAGFRADFRKTALITGVSVALYLIAIAVSDGFFSVFAMRAVYLAIAGYIIGFFGEQRSRFEYRLRELETEAERESIARDLHDGFIQALAGLTLRLESCRDMLASDQNEEALAEVREIQSNIAREYDEVRAYVRDLAQAEAPVSHREFRAQDAACTVSAVFSGSGALVEHVLHIMLEGLRNALRHGRAESASITATESPGAIRVEIQDDGVGFGDEQRTPWTISSRVAELGGRLTISSANLRGARLELEIPRA